jgi:hypothetical protein
MGVTRGGQLSSGPLSSDYSLVADIRKQTKDLSDGTQIKSVMVRWR